MLLLERTPASAASPRRRLPWCTPILPGSTVRLSRTCHAVPGYREHATALAVSAPRDRGPLPAVPPARRVPYFARPAARLGRANPPTFNRRTAPAPSSVFSLRTSAAASNRTCVAHAVESAAT